MTYFLRRAIKVALFLLCFHSSFAVTYYVNASNPTPGAGTSWATAYNNLQSALAVAGFIDQIWVAQGTYYPSVPAGRNATFTIKQGFYIYGGFNGTETSLSQANPTLYPTILSGDIGVAGDPTDNCYHVMTFNNNVSVANNTGLIIRDGRADGATAPDNTGGGVLFLAANSGEIANTNFDHCVFSNNYAVYGGAIGGYSGNGAIQVGYGVTNSFFHDNQAAIAGGAMYNTVTNCESQYYLFNNVFYNNTAASGNASVFANLVTNTPGSSGIYVDIENCLFYNEALPILANDLVNSPYTGTFRSFNDIIWSSGAPYTGNYSTGNTPIAIVYSDIDGPLPSTTDFDADPLFVNAAGYNFHVSPCSPVIDAGENNSTITTDLDGNARVQGSAIDVGPYETLKGTAGSAPGVSTPQTVCQNVTVPDLTTDVTSTAGATLTWYTVPTGGTGSSTMPTQSTSTTGTLKYYVSQTPSGSCESPRAEIDVSVLGASAAPTPNVVSAYCENATASALSATGAAGAVFNWYSVSTGGTGTTTAPTPSTTTPGTTAYYVSQTPSGSCESPRAEVDVTVLNASTPPATTAVSPYCQNSTAAQLTATPDAGESLLWYTVATGGTSSATAPTPSTTTPGTTAYYVSQTAAGSCESPRAELDVTVLNQGSAPIASSPTYCQYAAGASILTTSGDNPKWYTDATGGTALTSAPTVSTADAGTTDYYVSQTPAGSCESPRTEVIVTINPNPQADFTYTSGCVGKGAQLAITAEAATAGSIRFTFGGDPTTSGSLSGPFTLTWNDAGVYPVVLTTTTGTCQSQTTHDITVNANPTVVIAPVSGSLCVGNQVSLVASGADNYQWSPLSGLSDPTVFDPVLVLGDDFTYTVTGTDGNGCSSTASVVLSVTPDCMVYYVPTAFTPNGDGKNDQFRVKTGDAPKSFELIIFNRFGGKVFESQNVDLGWAGNIGSDQAPTGAYVYVLSATTANGVVVKKKGTVMLVR